eukprot:m.112011 g.112011  ORF g.112011 m.112011 type:complete len:107 (+) comp28161_c0_seq1:1103-1423(+)
MHICTGSPKTIPRPKERSSISLSPWVAQDVPNPFFGHLSRVQSTSDARCPYPSQSIYSDQQEPTAQDGDLACVRILRIAISSRNLPTVLAGVAGSESSVAKKWGLR